MWALGVEVPSSTRPETPPDLRPESPVPGPSGSIPGSTTPGPPGSTTPGPSGSTPAGPSESTPPGRSGSTPPGQSDSTPPDTDDKAGGMPEVSAPEEPAPLVHTDTFNEKYHFKKRGGLYRMLNGCHLGLKLVGCWRFTSLQHLKSYQYEYWLAIVHSLSEFIVLTHCDYKAVGIMTWYPTRSYYPAADLTSPCPILLMPTIWVRSDKYSIFTALV